MNKKAKRWNVGSAWVSRREDTEEERGCRGVAPVSGRMRAILVATLLWLGGYPLQAMAAGNVVLWNKLGSNEEIAHSEIGPGGEKTGGSFTSGPLPDFGQAHINDAQKAFQALTFPANAVVSETKGTIAFWAKLNNFPNALFNSITPLHYVPKGSHPEFRWRMGFGSNNGCGGGGFYGTVGVATNAYCYGLVDTATGDGTLDGILGDRDASMLLT